MGFGSGGGYRPSPNNIQGDATVSGGLTVSGSGGTVDITTDGTDTLLEVSGSLLGAMNLFQVESALGEAGANEPAFSIVQNSDGRWYITVGQATQTTYATAWNMSNGINSTLYLSNGTVFMASGVNMVYTAPTVPASSTASGLTGQISWGDDGGTHYLYICTSGGGAGAATWKRVALSTF
jgi:hypothetical protein